MAARSEMDVQDEVEYEDEDFKVGPHRFKVTTIAFMPIEVLMAMGEKKVEISGQKLWCGSLGVIEYLLGNPAFVSGKTVLELGAGTGVLSMLAKRLGASRVIMTDNDPRSLKHMAQDCPKNNIDAEVRALDWFDATAIEALQLDDSEADTSSSSSLSSTSPESVGEQQPRTQHLRVVAGDVLYKKELLQPFMSTVQRLLAAFPGSQMLLCHIPRAGIEQAEIVALARSKSLVVEEVAREQWCKGSCTEYSPEEDYSRAKLYLLRSS